MESFDAIIIGIGQAGNPLAGSLADKGKKVAVIERQHPGGSCINYGCTPTKTMVASAHAAQMTREAFNLGISVERISADFQKIIERRDGIVSSWRDGIEKKMKDNEHISYLFGEASFSGPKELQVKMNGSEEVRQITATQIFINVGTSPRIPPIERIEDINYYTSKSMMELTELPEHLVIIGGSYIGLEFSQIYRRLGSRVTVIQKDDQLASREDKDVADTIREFLEEEGIQIHLIAETKSVEQNGAGIILNFTKGSEDISTEGTHLLIATGTTPNTSKLHLNKAGIQTDKRGYIQVNDHLETNVEGVFALGDCKGGPEFTHISYDDYRIVEDYLLGTKKRHLKDRPVPYTMFTKPELGRIGLDEKQAKKKGIAYQVARMPMSYSARAIEANQTTGLLKALLDPESGEILGATCLAESGGEMMAMLQIAMMGGIHYQQLRDGIFAHPTYAEAWNTLFSSIVDPDGN
jgi:pyruvate/2-oxoglutarate dehydrogenase complex dihydrolipoamide dehydrogenase (E3) component